MKNTAYTITTTPSLIIPADNKTRTVVLHSGTGSVYIGNGNVTSSNGVHLQNGTTLQLVIPDNETLYAVTAAASQTLITLTPDVD